ncbi:MAG: PHB depolymerase family esterase [Mycobacteriales bacterium]|nr:PHB depolymerase family esterase [Mycobacteriales bacterium]
MRALATALVTTGLLAGLLATASPAAAGTTTTVSTETEPARALSSYTTTSDGVPRFRIGETELPPPVAAGQAFLGELEWRSGTVLRRVRVYVPSTAKPTAPLLVSLHGLRNTVSQAERQQRWRQGAFERGAVVAWAGGLESSWNAHGCCGAARDTGVDDDAYLDRVRAIVAALHPVDRRRVFLAGFSNGAMMAYRYACERPGVVAGILAVAGTMTSPCRPRSAVAVLSVHGTADTRVPLGGTAWSAALGTRLPPARDAVRRYAAVGSGVRSVIRTGLGHAWPTTSQGYDATGQGWRFLMAHPRP